MLTALIVGLVYSGPLADRRVDVPPQGGHGAVSIFFEVPHLAGQLALRPLTVLAPGSDHLGYGLKAYHQGQVVVFRFNLRLSRDAHAAGPTPAQTEREAGIYPPRGDALRWALGAARSMGFEPAHRPPGRIAEENPPKSWADRLAAFAQDRYDPAIEARVLADWARRDLRVHAAMAAPAPEAVTMQPDYAPNPRARGVQWEGQIDAESAAARAMASSLVDAPRLVLDPQTEGAGCALGGTVPKRGAAVIRFGRFNGLHAAISAPLVFGLRAASKEALTAASGAMHARPFMLPDALRCAAWIESELALAGVEGFPHNTRYMGAGRGGPYRAPVTVMDAARFRMAGRAFHDPVGYDLERTRAQLQFVEQEVARLTE